MGWYFTFYYPQDYDAIKSATTDLCKKKTVLTPPSEYKLPRETLRKCSRDTESYRKHLNINLLEVENFPNVRFGSWYAIGASLAQHWRHLFYSV